MNILAAEIELLKAVRNHLRTELSYTDQQCNCELDDQVPAIAGDLFVAVCPGGISDGRNHAGGNVIDQYLSIRVTPIVRIADVPRDRRRNIFIDRLAGINFELDRIIDLVDFSYNVNVLANAELGDTYFLVPFEGMAIDSRPRTVGAEVYDSMKKTGSGHNVLGMARSVTFQRARFCKVR